MCSLVLGRELAAHAAQGRGRLACPTPSWSAACVSGGGEAWDDAMCQLRHHWEEVGRDTGQPFSYELLDDKERSFDHDTEPPCAWCCRDRARDAAGTRG